jgi:protein-S-isoprenylcysteine O-methyltransferase Ste14
MTAKRYAELAARARVPSGFLIAALYVWFARPRPLPFAAGVAVALSGLAVRAWAAGHLQKNQQLATAGPYAWSRNPLYIGTALVALGFAIAGATWWLGALFAVYLIAIYLPVVMEEEAHLRKLFPEYAEYARSVPRIVPRLGPWHKPATARTRFQWATWRRNEEYNALLGFAVGVAVLLWKLRG